jgi:hypothetical protein
LDPYVNAVRHERTVGATLGVTLETEPRPRIRAAESPSASGGTLGGGRAIRHAVATRLLQ